MPRGNERVAPRVPPSEAAIAFALFAAVTFAAYWPVFAHPFSTGFRPFANALQADVRLLVWILSTIARSLTENPTHLFAGNTLYPDPAPIVHSEHLLALQVFFAPIFYATGSPVAALQGTLFLSSTLCGTAMYVLLRHWGTVPAAALFGGFVYTIFPARYFEIHAPHATAVCFLPVALLFLDRLWRDGRWRDAGWFGLFVLLQMLTSFYLAFLTVFVVAAYGAGKLVAQRNVSLAGLAKSAVATALASAVLLVVAIPYLANASQGEFPDHSRGLLILSSNSPWKSYLYPPIAIRNWGWKMFGLETYLGIVPLTLAAGGVVFRLRPLRRSPVLPLLAVVVVTYALSLGPTLGPRSEAYGNAYDLAMAYLPGFSVMRVPHRFGAGVMLAVAALAGLGLSALFTAFPRTQRAAWLVVPALAALVVVEFGLVHYRYRPLPLPPEHQIPPIYRDLAELDAGPVLEVPGGFIDGTYQMLESRYAYFSVYHRQNLLNGYTGYWPESYHLLMSTGRALPDPRAIDLLKRLTGLRYVIVHDDLLPAPERVLWNNPSGMRLVRKRDSSRLFELAEGEADLLTALLDGGPARKTLLGTPLAPLGEAGLQAAIGLTAGQSLDPAHSLPLEHGSNKVQMRVFVENRSHAAWPALALDPARLVHWAYRWERPNGEVLQSRSQRLAFDLAPGERLATTLRLVVPPANEPLRLVVGLRQGDQWTPQTLRFNTAATSAGSGS